MPSIINYLEEDQNASVSRPERLFLQLQHDILTGKLRSGDRLTERKVCDTYHISRTPVREALLRLEVNGLVELVPNKGAVITGLNLQEIRDLEIMEADAEVLAVRLGILRITRPELEKLTEVYEYMEFYTMKKDLAKMKSINAAFHQIIEESAHSRILEKHLQLYREYLACLAPLDEHLPDFLSDVLTEHRRIYRAYLAKNPEEGAAAMRQHSANSSGRRIITSGK